MKCSLIGNERARRSAKSEAGFTLLELLVALTITLVLTGLMLAVVTGTLNLWHRTQDGFSTSAQTKLALDMIERDLQAAVFRKDGGTWLAVDVTNTPAMLAAHGWITSPTFKPATSESQRLLPDMTDGTAPSIGQARFGLSGAWLRFVTTNVEAGGSLPIVVSYQVARRPLSGAVDVANPAELRYTLFRAAVSTENTFASGNDVTAPAYGSASTAPTASRNPATVTNPNNADALATNVVDFGIWLYVRDSAAGMRRIFPADNSDISHAVHDTGAAPDNTRFPNMADVMVRILTERGAALLSEMENGNGRLTRPAVYASDAEWSWAVVEANSRIYTRRVEVKGGAL
jgi:prepilin-type N-terminal cleavage/methylation domain-containing protein